MFGTNLTLEPTENKIKTRSKLDTNYIKQIIQNVINQSQKNNQLKNQCERKEGKASKGSSHYDNFQLCMELLNRKKIVCQDRLHKVRREMKIFQKLVNYIDFQQIFHKIVYKITQKFYQEKQQRQRQLQQQSAKNKILTPPDLLFEMQIDQVEQVEINEIMKQINYLIKAEYGAKFVKAYKEEAQHIACVLEQQVSSINKDSFVADYFKKIQHQKKFKDYQNNFKPLSDGQPLAYNLMVNQNMQTGDKESAKYKKRQGAKNISINKLYFSKTDKIELQKYYREALTLLGLFIRRQKRKTSLNNLKKSKINLSQDFKNDMFHNCSSFVTQLDLDKTCPANVYQIAQLYSNTKTDINSSIDQNQKSKQIVNTKISNVYDQKNKKLDKKISFARDDDLKLTKNNQKSLKKCRIKQKCREEQRSQVKFDEFISQKDVKYIKNIKKSGSVDKSQQNKVNFNCENDNNAIKATNKIDKQIVSDYQSQDEVKTSTQKISRHMQKLFSSSAHENIHLKQLRKKNFNVQVCQYQQQINPGQNIIKFKQNYILNVNQGVNQCGGNKNNVIPRRSNLKFNIKLGLGNEGSIEECKQKMHTTGRKIKIKFDRQSENKESTSVKSMHIDKTKRQKKENNMMVSSKKDLILNKSGQDHNLEQNLGLTNRQKRIKRLNKLRYKNQLISKLTKIIQQIDHQQLKNKHKKSNFNNYFIEVQKQYTETKNKIDDEVFVTKKEIQMQIVQRSRNITHHLAKSGTSRRA